MTAAGRGRGAVPEERGARWRIAVVVGILSGGGQLALNVTVPSLPGLAASLHLPYDAVAAGIPAFLLGFAASQLVFGALADHGRPVALLLAGLALFAAASAALATLADPLGLALARAAQGFGIGAAVAIPRALLREYAAAGDLRSLQIRASTVFTLVPPMAILLGAGLAAADAHRLVPAVLVAAGAAFLAIALAAFGGRPAPAGGAPLLPSLWRAAGGLPRVLAAPLLVRRILLAGVLLAVIPATLTGLPPMLERAGGTALVLVYGVLGLVPCMAALVALRLTGVSTVRIARLSTAAVAALGLALVLAPGPEAVSAAFVAGIVALWFAAGVGAAFLNGTLLAEAGERSGTVSGLLGALQMAVGAASAALVPLLAGGLERPLSATIAVLALAAVLLAVRDLRSP